MNREAAKAIVGKACRALLLLARSRPKTVAAALLALVALAAAGTAFSSSDVSTATAIKGVLTTSVPFSGVLKAEDSERLGPPQVPRVWRYKISMMAPEGKEAKKGEPVLGFDPSDLKREMDSKLAESATAASQVEKTRAQMEIKRQEDALALAQAEANLRKAKMQSDIPPELKPTNDIKGAKLDAALYARQIESLKVSMAADMAAFARDLASQREARDRAKARVAEIESAITQMTVQSPRAGTVIYITSEETQQKKQVGDDCWVGEKVIEVASLSKMSGEGEVDESDAGKLAGGQRVRLSLDAHPDEEFNGTVRSVGTALEAKSPANPLKVVKVEVSLDKTDPKKMMPGMRFTGFIETGSVQDAILIPPDAVTETSGGATVRVRTLFGWRTAKIKLGERGKEMVQVLAGLREGQVLARRASLQGAAR